MTSLPPLLPLQSLTKLYISIYRLNLADQDISINLFYIYFYKYNTLFYVRSKIIR